MPLPITVPDRDDNKNRTRIYPGKKTWEKHWNEKKKQEFSLQLRIHKCDKPIEKFISTVHSVEESLLALNGWVVTYYERCYEWTRRSLVVRDRGGADQ